MAKMDPNNGDDGRLYANNNALGYNSQVNIYEFEPILRIRYGKQQ